MQKIKTFIASAKGRFSPASYEKIKEALRLAISCSSQRVRYDGSPFAEHAVGVAAIVIEELELGATSVIASLLHDAVREGQLDSAAVRERFGDECAEVLDGMTNISAVETKPNREQVEHFKELIVSYSTNPRIILIKLADRLEVMRSLDIFPQEKRLRKAWETLHVYSQLAHKLGLYKMKSEMEDLSLRYLEPDDYEAIRSRLEATADARENFIETFVAPIRERLLKDGLAFTVKGRTKSIYSIWRKMKKQRIPFEEVYDVFAIRIVIDCPPAQEKSLCWHVYSVVTDFYNPNPQRMRDWISIPKSNGYESLHTTVVTDQGKWVEVQIRSGRMDVVAERGIAAHWRYKGVEGGRQGSGEWLARLREMMENADVDPDGGRLNFNLPMEPTSKEVFVFTPNGDLRKLPEGATLLDFAYDIHSDLGNHCVGGRINRRNVQIREVLKNGDLVEVMTVKTQKPKPDWLHIAVTNKARSRIRNFLREEAVKQADIGREELERKLRNWKLPLSLEESVTLLQKHYKLKTGLEFYGLIAEEKIPMSEIKELLQKHLAGENITRTTEERGDRKEKREGGKEDCLVIDERLRDVEYKLAKCCNPIYGDDIFAFVTVLNGISVHRQDCANGNRLRERFPYRVLKAQWSADHSAGRSFSARIGISADDVMGLEPSIRDVFKTLRIHLRNLSLSYGPDGVSGVLTVEVSSLAMLDSVIYNLLKIKGMNKAFRLQGN